MIHKNLYLILFFLCCGTPVFSQTEKIDTDRPDQTESAVTVPHKWLQFEMGFGRQANSPGQNEYQHPTLLSKYGISKKIEFRLITTLRTDIDNSDPAVKQTVNGLSPVEVGAKIALWEEKKLLPKTSLIFHVGIPKLASNKLQTDHLAPNFRFSMQHSLTNNIGLGYNLGAQWDGESKAATWIYTLAPGISLGKKWYAYIEAFGFISKQHEPEHSLDAGIAFFISDNFKIDISSGFGISPAAPDWYMAVGGSFRFKTGN
ncbi:MAG: transporter [Chitinophagaceae bacterium]|nr:transporter [Chitinophagaceae bacterium]